MAFRMNRPIIKGTANHKASVAKATKQSIVSQARTTVDASLVGAGKSLGESYIPAAMDYTVNQKGIDFADVKKEGGEGKSSKPKKMKKAKPKKLKVKTKGPDLKKRNAPEYNPSKEDGLPTDYIKPPKKEKKPKGEGWFKKAGKWVNKKTGEVVQGIKDKKADAEAKKKADAEARKKAEEAELKAAELQAAKDAENKANKPTVLEPRSARSLPTNKQKIELQKSTGTVATTESTDRQFDRLDEHIEEKSLDIDPNTEQGQKAYRKLYEEMTYDEKTDEWKVPHIEIDTPKTQKNKQDTAKMYQVSTGDLELQEDGSYVPREGAKSNYGDSWGDMGNGTMGWLDDGEEQYYGPEGQKVTKEFAEKYGEKREAKGIERQRKIKKNKLIADFKKAWPGKRVTQSNLDEFASSVDEEDLIEIEEEDDPEVWEAEPVVEETTTKPVVEQTTTEPVVEQTTTTTPDRKPRPSDFEGTWKQRQEQYKIANEKWYQAQQEKKGKSPATMRDNRIYRNAIKGGTVQQNMIKSGYKPE